MAWEARRAAGWLGVPLGALCLPGLTRLAPIAAPSAANPLIPIERLTASHLDPTAKAQPCGSKGVDARPCVGPCEGVHQLRPRRQCRGLLGYFERTRALASTCLFFCELPIERPDPPTENSPSFFHLHSRMNVDDWTAIAAIGTMIGALASAAVCAQTFAILRATRKTLEEARREAERVRRPVVEVSAWPKGDQGVLMLSVRNIGANPAQNLHLTMDRDFFFDAQQGPATNVRNYGIFRDRIDALAPRAEINLVLGAGFRIFEHPDVCPLKFGITAAYSFEGVRYEEVTQIDMAPFGKHATVQDPALAETKKLIAAVQGLTRAVRDAAPARTPGEGD